MNARPVILAAALAVVSVAIVVAEDSHIDRTPTPTPTVTHTVTAPPVTETVTVRVTQRASRSENRTPQPIKRPDTSGAVIVTDPATLAAWQQTYWRKAQTWAATAKARAVVMCESANNPRAVSRTGKYRGLWQFDARTWASYGGLDVAPRPDLATRAAQNYVAYRLYSGRGWAPWTCA